MDIAPLGFGIDTSGLERGKRAAADFGKTVGDSVANVDKLAAANLKALKTEKDAADATAKHAEAKLRLLRTTENVSAASIKEAKATLDGARAAQQAATAKYDLAKAGGDVEKALEGVTQSGSVVSGVLQGVAREAAAMASTMGLGSAAGRLGAAGAMGAAQGAAARLTPQLASLGGIQSKIALGVGSMVVGYVALAATIADNQDRWASYQQQLVNSLGSQGAAASSLKEVVAIANEVGISIDASLTSFNRFARAREDIGATNEELVLLTETIMKLGRSSGVEAGAMQGAMMQLSQALASGRLNGDELRSIMENMQPLAKAIAEGLGVGIGELRRMGAEGELTGEKVFRALLSQSGKAEQAFKTMPKTVEQAKTRMANQFDELAAHIGKLTGASDFMRRNFEYLSKPIEWLNAAFNAAADEGMAKAETNLQKIEARVARIKTKTAVDEEFDKQFNKDAAKQTDLEKQRRESEDRLAKHISKMRDLQMLMEVANNRMQARRDEIDAMQGQGRRGKAFEGKALERIGELGLTDFQAWQKQFDDINRRVGLDKSGLAELNRQLEQLKRNDPFEKMGNDVRVLEEALRVASGGMVGMRIQAEEMAATTGRSVEDVIAQLTRLRVLQTDQDIASKQRAASIQRELAEALAGGQDKITAESAAEAAQHAFDQFGDSVDANSDIVRRYTAALIDMKLAMQAVGDAAEVTRLKTQLGDINAQIGAVGSGSYASRLAQHQSGIAAFQAERTGMGGGGGSITVGGSGTPNVPADIVAFFTGRGYSREQALGIAAGIMSESSGNHMALNPDSGAYGLGQHLGSRKRAMFGRYGFNPSRTQQLQFLDYELRGGDFGGASVLQGTSAADVATRYIRDFMRPGKDTAGGIARALRHLGGGSATISAGVDLTGNVVGARNDLFNAQEKLRTEQFLNASQLGATDMNSRVAALRGGGPEAVRRLELELKVQQAINDNAPIYAAEVESAIRTADAAERRWQAEQEIFNLKTANDNQARRNGALATGDPAQLRALELQLRIEEIRRTAPAAQQGRLIDEAKRDDALNAGEQVARRQGEIRNQNRALLEQVKLIGMVGEEERVAVRLMEEKNALYAMGSTLAGDELAAHLQLVEVLERQNIALEKQIERWRFIRDWSNQLWTDVGDGGAKAFGQLTRTGEISWKGLMGSMEEAFYAALDRMVQQFIISPLINFATGLLSSGLNALLGGGNNLMTNNGSTAPITWTANGGVFGSGGPVPFAGGGIVNAPTGFFMPGGRRGLAGEGPGIYEGILPLRRGPDGRLGVSAQGGGGGGTQVNVYDMRSAGSSEAVEVEERQSGDGMRQIDVLVRDSVRGHIRKGSFDNDMRGSFGQKRTVQRR
jgi:tape measure domain-containing protein